MRKVQGILAIAAISIICALQTACASPQADRLTQPATLSDEIINTRKAATKPTTWQYEDEQQWLVASVSQDIAEMLAFAKLKGADSPSLASDCNFKILTLDKDKNIYNIELKNSAAKIQTKYKLQLHDYIWATKNYQPYAENLLAEFALKPSNATTVPANFLQNLAQNDWNGLRAENERVSAALTQNPLDPSLHEQAALVIARLRINEVADNFTDGRNQLSRGCAHLSIAQALRGGTFSQLGQLAATALELMSVREGMVLEKLEALTKSTSDKAMLSWLRALKIRATCDYRLFNEAEHTNLEESQYVLRCAFDSKQEKMFDYVRKHYATKQPLPLIRPIVDANSSVQLGHVLATTITAAELEDFIEDYKASRKTPIVSRIDFETALKDLNLTPKRCLHRDAEKKEKLEIVSWEDRAAFHCRHILSAINCEYRFNRYQYGVEENAKETIKKSLSTLHMVKWLPLVESNFYLADDLDYAAANMALHDIMNYAPEMITSGVWSSAMYFHNNGKPPAAYPFVAPETWFAPALPMGTAYFYCQSREFENAKNDLASLTELRTYSPFNVDLNEAWAKAKYGKNPDTTQMEEAFGSMSNYSIEALKILARSSIQNQKKFLEIGEKICSDDPFYYMTLGEYCARRNLDEQAAKYYQLGVDKNSENGAVGVANNCEWLINYYLEHNEYAKARKLADFAQDVYSYNGLIAAAAFHEKVGEMAAADQIYSDLTERYSSKTERLALWTRVPETATGHEKEKESLTNRLFNGKMEPVTLNSFAGKPAPTEGVEIEHVNIWLPKPKLPEETIIVGVNGFKVKTGQQLSFCDYLTKTNYISLIYWNGHEYKETKEQWISMHALGYTIRDYKH